MPFPIRFHIGVFQQLEIRRGDEAVQPRAVILPVRADDGAHRVQSEWDSERRVREQDFDKPWYNLRGIVCALVELNVLGEIALLKVAFQKSLRKACPTTILLLEIPLMLVQSVHPSVPRLIDENLPLAHTKPPFAKVPTELIDHSPPTTTSELFTPIGTVLRLVFG